MSLSGACEEIKTEGPYTEKEFRELSIKMRNELGCGWIECKSALRNNDYNYELAKAHVLKWRDLQFRGYPGFK